MANLVNSKRKKEYLDYLSRKTYRRKYKQVNDNKIESMLFEKGLKATDNRILIVRLLMRRGGVMTAVQIEKELKTVNLVSIYRALKNLVNAGLLRMTEFRKGQIYYEFEKHHHHHLVCKECGDVESIDVCLGNGVLEKVKGKTKKFSEVLDHQLEFFGVCNNCVK